MYNLHSVTKIHFMHLFKRMFTETALLKVFGNSQKNVFSWTSFIAIRAFQSVTYNFTQNVLYRKQIL